MRVVLHVYKIVTVIFAVSVSTVSECFESDLKTHIVTGWGKVLECIQSATGISMFIMIYKLLSFNTFLKPYWNEFTFVSLHSLIFKFVTRSKKFKIKGE